MAFQRLALAATAASSILFAAVPAAAQTTGPLTGTWRGQVTQAGRDVTYPVVLVFTSRGITSSYPDTPCNGNLKRVGASPNFAFYAEEITRGRFDAARGQGCLDGTVTLHRAGDRLYYSWFGIDGGEHFSAVAVLTREGAAAPPPRPNAPAAAPPG